VKANEFGFRTQTKARPPSSRPARWAPGLQMPHFGTFSRAKSPFCSERHIDCPEYGTKEGPTGGKNQTNQAVVAQPEDRRDVRRTNRRPDRRRNMIGSKKLGDIGEQMAEKVYAEDGFQILETNFRCRSGEIDIIAEKDFCFHFVEVKTRRGDDFGYPAESVNETKQRRMQAAARYYMHMNRLENVRVQFDVVEIEVNQIGNCI